MVEKAGLGGCISQRFLRSFERAGYLIVQVITVLQLLSGSRGTDPVGVDIGGSSLQKRGPVVFGRSVRRLRRSWRGPPAGNAQRTGRGVPFLAARFGVQRPTRFA